MARGRCAGTLVQEVVRAARSVCCRMFLSASDVGGVIGRIMIGLTKTRQPGAHEKIEHEMTCLPFRRWCRHCVSGRGKEEH